MLEDVAQAVGLALPPGLDLVLIGETRGWLGQSLWLREIAGREDGAPPPVDLVRRAPERRFRPNAQILGAARCAPATTAPTAASWSPWPRWPWPPAPAPPSSPPPEDLSEHAFWFGEDQARYVLAVPDAAPLLDAARAAGIPAIRLGRRGGEALVLAGDRSISVRSLRDAHEATLPALMGEA